MLKELTLFSAALCLAACSGSTEEASSSMSPKLQSFEAALTALDTQTDVHQSSIMESDSVNTLTLVELQWAQMSLNVVAKIDASLNDLSSCRDSEGLELNTDDARAALMDLRLEFRAHQVGMLTVVDTETARAAELIQDARQAVLVDELQGYFDAFVLVADDYSCAF